MIMNVLKYAGELMCQAAFPKFCCWPCSGVDDWKNTCAVLCHGKCLIRHERGMSSPPFRLS
eukprot:6176009-Pleurochrysis_carterae.AAC.3